MYKPSEISNTILLSSYLRTSHESLDVFANGQKLIIDFKKKKLPKSDEYDPHRSILIQRFYIPKRNKKLGFRVVYKLMRQTPRDILKVLKFNLNILYHPVGSVHGFVKKRNTLSNANCHLEAKFLLKLDVKNFFESISFNSVVEAFESLGFNSKISEELTKITTLEGKLVQGYSTSPILANLVCVRMDKEIKMVCDKEGATYTRYADDISISSNVFFERKELIEAILLRYGFELNNSKTERFRRGQNQYVTGLSISDRLHPRIPKHIKKRLRQQLHYIKLYGYHSHITYVYKLDEKDDELEISDLAGKLCNSIKGWIDFMKPIEPELAEKMYEQYNLIVEIERKKSEERFKKLLKENGDIIMLGVPPKKHNKQ
jgi:RNA-directed DNA polymerase